MVSEKVYSIVKERLFRWVLTFISVIYANSVCTEDLLCDLIMKET